VEVLAAARAAAKTDLHCLGHAVKSAALAFGSLVPSHPGLTTGTRRYVRHVIGAAVRVLASAGVSR
ncbi:MAG: hypothetical protein J0H43_10225, partial [Actinobacteria bacterium]|nr:hypothetical protein [Actinomycetota bacterium]